MFMCIASVCSIGTLCVKHGCDKTLVLLTRYLQITAGKLIYMYTRRKVQCIYFNVPRVGNVLVSGLY